MDLFTLLLPWPMRVRPHPSCVDAGDQPIVIDVASITASAPCPVCGVVTQRVHSRYTRRLADLPWAGQRVDLQAQVHKFICANPACRRRIFTERLPALAPPWGRRTRRLAEQQRQLGLVAGGSAGARLSQRLGRPASRNTILRLVRRAPPSVGPTPRVIGVDDFALRKGHTYGTILVDLERRVPLALLSGRDGTALTAWLHAHPGVEIIARDRASAYADGAAAGAPQARQVADRFHLLRNLAETLIHVFESQSTALQSVPTGDPALPAPLQDPALPVHPLDPAPPAIASQLGLQPARDPVGVVVDAVRPPACPARPERPAYRQARYEQVIGLHQQGWTATAIARQVGLNRKTVRHYVQAGRFTERRRPGSVLDPYKPYLITRWNAGCRTGMQLLEEIRRQGYPGGRSVALSYVTRLRQAQGLPPRSRAFSTPHATCTATDVEQRLSPRRAAWRVLQRPDREDEADRHLLDRLRQAHPHVDAGITLAQDFAHLLRARRPDQLDAWLARAAASPLAAFRRFATSLQRDYDAVKAGVTGVWSNGQAEGQINRLKMLKRQMFGRASLPLLAQRVIQAH